MRETNFPVVSYNNAETKKLAIFTDNKGLEGIYRWVNLKNGKMYIGSSVNLVRRLKSYYNINVLMNGNMAIYKAILLHGHSEFSLDILEYCEPENVIDRENYLSRIIISYRKQVHL